MTINLFILIVVGLAGAVALVGTAALAIVLVVFGLRRHSASKEG